VFRRLDAKRVDLLLGGSGYDHESNGRTKRIKLDPLVNIRNESVFFKYPKLEIDLVDLD
jgi:hypothetical protein